MKRAFRYDGDDTAVEISSCLNDTEMKNYMQRYHNFAFTENGAVGYASTMHPLADLNFMVSSLRNRDENFIVREFVKAYYDEPKYAVKWLFFLRDIAQGLGERRTFRICMKYLADSHTEIARTVYPLIPEYGRYDDLLLFLDTGLKREVSRFLKEKLEEDELAMQEGRPVSLLAKWLPGINTSSLQKRQQAGYLAERFGMSPAGYRKTLSALRAYGNVVETKMTAGKWKEITYENVPAKAGMNYQEAFARHDRKGYETFLGNVLKGKAKLNSRGIMPHEVVHRYMKDFRFGLGIRPDTLTEMLWRCLLEQGFENDWGLEDCIVVADGSGSMYSFTAGGSGVRAIEICNALAIYFAQQLKGVFHNKAITFSARPQFIDLNRGRNLKEKLEILLAYNEVANTNIEAVFDLLLDLASDRKVPREMIPKQVLIISDMEFDEASAPKRWYDDTKGWKKFTPILFEQIEERFQRAGYPMPRLIFWNVCGRSDTIPKVEGEQGICLLSGFSQNAVKIAAHREITDPWESLKKVLDSERYAPVENLCFEKYKD